MIEAKDYTCKNETPVCTSPAFDVCAAALHSTQLVEAPIVCFSILYMLVAYRLMPKG